MNLFERLNNRFSRSAVPSKPSKHIASASAERRPVGHRPPLAQDTQDLLINAPNISVTDYDITEDYANAGRQQTRTAIRPPFAQTVPPSTQSGDSHRVKSSAGNVNNPDKRAKTPLSSFYNVSSDEDDSSGESSVNDTVNEKDDGTDDFGGALARRSSRQRRSLNKAKAALPVDFADRIGISSEMCESTYHEGSGSKVVGKYDSTGGGGGEDPSTFPESNSEDENELKPVQPSRSEQFVLFDKVRVTEKKSISNLESEFSILEDISGSLRDNDEGVSKSGSSAELLWRSDPPTSLDELMPHFRSYPPGKAYFVRAIAQRSDCRCALCGHNSLLLFPVLDTSLALAHWSSWSPAAKSHGRLGFHLHSKGGYLSTTSDVQAELIVFRQCRGWYEILNENHQPIPCLNTVEQMRRAKPSTFLVRTDLRCLLAPPSLVIPPMKDIRSPGDGRPSCSPSLVAAATAVETLTNTMPEVIPAGTLMHYLTYLPHCVLKRGRKSKELGLLLATVRSSEPSKQQQPKSNLPLVNRTYYIGLEDTTPAVFPPKFEISPVAGPANISGVHSFASILRKFRLPISVRPVFMTDTSQLQQDSHTQQYPLLQSSGGVTCGLSAVPGLSFNDNNFLRLESVYRSDLLIISPTSAPDRLFLVTPSMLPDHVFQLGESDNLAHLELLENHRLHSSNFMAVAHPKDSLAYLIRHMRDVTREPRTSYSTRRNKPGASENELSTEDIYRIYDELDDIYFYIRHGYYPSRSRIAGETCSRTDYSRQHIPKGNVDSAGFYSQPDLDGLTKKMSDEPPAQSRTSLPTAETLLAASLATPMHSSHRQPRLNGTWDRPNYRSQPKEHGV